jgi:hypothetical protein
MVIQKAAEGSVQSKSRHSAQRGSERLEQRLAELAEMATRTQRALYCGQLARMLDDQHDGALRQAVMEMVGDFETLVGDVTERLSGLSGVIQTLHNA